MLYWEDIELGMTVASSGHTFTEAEIIDFARDYDPQWFHVDPEAAKKSQWGGLIASGWHTTAVAMRLMVDSVIKNYASLGSPGFDDLHFLGPVRPGDTLVAHLTFAAKMPSKSRADVGSCTSETKVLNQRGETVLTMKNIGLYRRRPQA
jgi:acyl dehydratase